MCKKYKLESYNLLLELTYCSLITVNTFKLIPHGLLGRGEVPALNQNLILNKHK